MALVRVSGLLVLLALLGCQRAPPVSLVAVALPRRLVSPPAWAPREGGTVVRTSLSRRKL
jgi:hypothetical protein